MESHKIIIVCILFVILCQFSYGQVTGSFDIYNRLESRLNNLNSSLIQQQKEIEALFSDIVLQQIGHADDIKKLQTKVKTAEDKLASIEKISKENVDLVASLSVQQVATELQMLDLTIRMDQLNVTNQLWRSNFQVVNRTFAELRKKFAFVVPGIKQFNSLNLMQQN